MKQRSLQRLANIDARFGKQVREAEKSAQDTDRFHAAWARVKAEIIEPTMQEVAQDLEARGFRAKVHADKDHIELRVFLRAKVPTGHRVTFEVIDRGLGLEVLAFLEATPPVTDIARYQPDALTVDVVEQLLVDALEHIFAVAADIR